ncbi:MAG: hypothetical protein ACJAX5_000387 [Patiriisocius sp.]|jgi:hypothetical protein
MYRKERVDAFGSTMKLLVFEPRAEHEGKGGAKAPFPAIVVAQYLPVAHDG